MMAKRELRSHVRGRHVRASSRMLQCEVFPCAAVFELLCAGPLPALAANTYGSSDYDPRRTSAAGE